VNEAPEHQAITEAVLTERRTMASTTAKKIASAINGEGTKLGDIKRHGKEIKKDHRLAMELWSIGNYHSRLLSTLIFDKKLLTQDVIEKLAADMLGHDENERSQLADWLLANQLMKDKKTAALIVTWQGSNSPILRRLFWYHQARLRWTGNTPPENSGALLDSLERDMADAPQEEQWAMNFCAGQIGVHEPKFRSRCIKLGKQTGLYKDDPVAKNCVPSYLPEFIRIEVAKRK
jgi:3-methyladenine DNA glycosylase AlkD